MTTAKTDEAQKLETRASEIASELEALKAREAALAEELATLPRKKRRLGMLEDVRVASPCPAAWDQMLGDHRVRFCTECEKNVYNISAMTKDEAEDLIAEKEGDLCVRFFQRADGTIMTADCPVGAKKKLRKKVALAVASAGAMALAAFQMLNKDVGPEASPPPVVDVHPVVVPPVIGDPPPTGGVPEGHWVAGGMHAVPDPLPLPKPVPKPRPRPKG